MAVPELEPDVVGELVVAEVLVPLVAVPDVVAVVLVPQPMAAADWLRGVRPKPGERLGG